MRAFLPLSSHGKARRPRLPGTAALVALAVLALECGCAQSALETTAAAAEKLSPTASAYVAVPEDGRFGTKIYAGSGREVAVLIARALSARLRRVEVADDERSTRANLAQARADGFTYLIQPEIMLWEDQPARWSGGADRARVLLEVIEAASGDAADVAIVATRMTEAQPPGEEYGDTPAAGFEAALAPYAARLLPVTAAVAAQR